MNLDEPIYLIIHFWLSQLKYDIMYVKLHILVNRFYADVWFYVIKPFLSKLSCWNIIISRERYEHTIRYLINM